MKIKQQRSMKNLSQDYVASRLDISQKTYCNLENGKSKLDVKRFFAILEIIELDIIPILKEYNLKLEGLQHCDVCLIANKLQSLQEIAKIQASHIIFLQGLHNRSQD